MSLTELVYPIITGLVLLGGQFLIQPRIAAREHFDRAKWDAKREMFSKAIALVNQKFGSIGDWQGSDVPSNVDTAVAGDPPSREEVNQCYAELALYSSRIIVRAFMACFGHTITATHRMNLIAVMRKDLGFGDSDLHPEDAWFVLKP